MSLDVLSLFVCINFIFILTGLLFQGESKAKRWWQPPVSGKFMPCTLWQWAILTLHFLLCICVFASLETCQWQVYAMFPQWAVLCTLTLLWICLFVYLFLFVFVWNVYLCICGSVSGKFMPCTLWQWAILALLCICDCVFVYLRICIFVKCVFVCLFMYLWLCLWQVYAVYPQSGMHSAFCELVYLSFCVFEFMHSA